MDVDKGIFPLEVTADDGRPVSMLRAYRLAAGIGQRELARRCGVTRQGLALIERGRVSPTIATCEQIADALGVSIGVLFGRQPSDREAALSAFRNARPESS